MQEVVQDLSSEYGDDRKEKRGKNLICVSYINTHITRTFLYTTCLEGQHYTLWATYYYYTTPVLSYLINCSGSDASISPC